MRLEMLWLILGMLLVTFLPRYLPLALLTRWSVNPRAKLALSFLPTAILSAIIFPIIISVEAGGMALEPEMILAAVTTFAFAFWKKNLWGTVLLGMLCYWLLGLVF